MDDVEKYHLSVAKQLRYQERKAKRREMVEKQREKALAKEAAK